MKHLLISSLFCLIIHQYSFAQVANHLVIAELYGGGGDQGSYWTNDYIVLYNPTTSSINLSSWSVQYAKFNGSTWEVTNLNGSIPPNGYYSIQEGGGVWGVLPLPFTSSAYGLIDIDKNKGKVALVNTQTPLAVSNPVGNPNVIDFIGYGQGTNAYEGVGPGQQLGLTSSLRRKDNNGNITYGTNGNGWDTDNNAGDTYMEIDIVTNPPLPVELSSFSAIIVNNRVKLKWRTETEVSNYGFEILRTHTSTPLSVMKWDVVGFVAGNGNSNSPKEYSFFDGSVTSGKYSYRLKQLDTDGNFDYSKIIEVDLGSPEKFELSQNYPNPFNPTTTINFSLPESGNVTLKIYNTIGEQVDELVNGFKEAGIYSISFDASTLNSGIYIYQISTNNLTLTKKMMLIK
jgi:hypothetical protein